MTTNECVSDCAYGGKPRKPDRMKSAGRSGGNNWQALGINAENGWRMNLKVREHAYRNIR